MNYPLTESQKEAVRWIHEQVQARKLTETFYVWWHNGKGYIGSSVTKPVPRPPFLLKRGLFDLLHTKGFIVRVEQGKGKISCTVTGALEASVQTDFAEEQPRLPLSALAQPHPPEIAMSIDRLRERYPDPKKLGFLIMRFAAAKPFARIVEVIQKTAEEHGLKVLRADAHEFHAGVLENVRTYLHGCGFGIAVYERIETNEPNANVGLEVGYLMAMNKPVLLLKDQTVPTLQADLAGKLYKPFDPHDPENTIPKQLTKWLEDYGIIVPNRIASPDNSPAL